MKKEVLTFKREEYLIKSIEEISMVEFLPITSERLVDLRRKTELDEGLQQFKHIIKIAWFARNQRRSPIRNQEIF